MAVCRAERKGTSFLEKLNHVLRLEVILVGVRGKVALSQLVWASILLQHLTLTLGDLVVDQARHFLVRACIGVQTCE